MAGVGNADNAFAQLNRFEQTVSKEEATAKAFDQLANAGTDHDLEKEFAQLGSGGGVDAELAALKAERKLPPPYSPKELAGPGGSLTIDVKANEKAGLRYYIVGFYIDNTVVFYRYKYLGYRVLVGDF